MEKEELTALEAVNELTALEAVKAYEELTADEAVKAYEAEVTELVMKLVAQLAVPNTDAVKFVIVALPTTVKLPVIFTDPVKVC
jgi:hypothetical protein